MLKKGLKTKFIIYLIPLVVFISFSFLAFFLNRANSLIKHELTQVGFSLVKSLSYSSELGVASEDEAFLRPYSEKVFQEENVVLVAIYNKDGRILFSSKKIAAEEMMPSQVMDSTRQGNVVKERSYTEQGAEFYDFYAPVYIGEILMLEAPRAKELGGFARVGLSLASIRDQTRMILIVGLGITFLLCILGIFISVFIASRLVKPIKGLEQGARAFAGGDFDYRIKIKTGDEIEDLADAFNKMARAVGSSRKALEESKQVLGIKVKARTKELEEMAEKLEEKVEERTKELRQRVDELERFHRLTVGRELKMIELKKELRKVQDGLAKTDKSIKGIEEERPLAKATSSEESAKKPKGQSKKPSAS